MAVCLTRSRLPRLSRTNSQYLCSFTCACLLVCCLLCLCVVSLFCTLFLLYSTDQVCPLLCFCVVANCPCSLHTVSATPQNKINPGQLNIRRIGWTDTDFDLDEIELDDFWQSTIPVRVCTCALVHFSCVSLDAVNLLDGKLKLTKLRAVWFWGMLCSSPMTWSFIITESNDMCFKYRVDLIVCCIAGCHSVLFVKYPCLLPNCRCPRTPSR